MVTPIYRLDGLPVAPAVAVAYVGWKQDHDKNCPCGVPLRINSGVRTTTEQAAIFTARYRKGAYSPYGDYRTYQGATWGRVSGAGPVQSPDIVSNHTRGYALDVNVTGGGKCQAWNLKNAPKHGFHWGEGQGISEPWHWNWALTGNFPTAKSPDPWAGHKPPTSIKSTDMGLGGWDAAVKAAQAKPAGSQKEDDMAVTSIYKLFQKTTPQKIKAGADFVGLHMNDKKDVSVVLGPARHVTGNLQIRIRGGLPYQGAVQVRPVVRDWVDGKTVKVHSLAVREVVFTDGDTFGEVAVDAPLKANQRLSFMIGVPSQDIEIISAVFRGVKID